jgi:hypothetical protein
VRMCVRGWAGGQLCACMLTVSSHASTNLGCDAVVCSAGAIDDLERALATQAFPVVQRWASLDGLDCADDPAIVTAAGMVDAILCELRVAPGQAPGVAGRGHVPYLLPGLSPVEEQLVGGVWSNASHQVRWVFTKCQKAHRETALTGHIVSIPQPSGPTMADGRPVSLATLPETFQIVFVGAGSLLADLQRQLLARADIDALEFRALPVVRRAAIESVMEHVWHYRIRGDRLSFSEAMTDPSWREYFASLPEVAIPASLLEAATPLSKAEAAEQSTRAAGYAPAESAQAVVEAGLADLTLPEASAGADSDWVCMVVDCPNMVSENTQEKARRWLASKGLPEAQRTSICASCYKKTTDGEPLQLRNGRTRGPRSTSRRSGGFLPDGAGQATVRPPSRRRKRNFTAPTGIDADPASTGTSPMHGSKSTPCVDGSSTTGANPCEHESRSLVGCNHKRAAIAGCDSRGCNHAGTTVRAPPDDDPASGSIAAAAAGANPAAAPSGVAADSVRTVPVQISNPGDCANDGRAATVGPRKRKLNFDVDFNASHAAMDICADSVHTVPPRVAHPGNYADGGCAASADPPKRTLNFDVDFNARRAAMDLCGGPACNQGDAASGDTGSNGDRVATDGCGGPGCERGGSVGRDGHSAVEPSDAFVDGAAVMIREGPTGEWESCHLVRRHDALPVAGYYATLATEPSLVHYYSRAPTCASWEVQRDDDGDHTTYYLYVAPTAEVNGPRKGKRFLVGATVQATPTGDTGGTVWRDVIVWPRLLISIESSGAVAIDSASLSADEKMTAAAANLVRSRGGESFGLRADGDDVVVHTRHGDLLSGMGDPQMFERMFVTLFVTGEGGPGSEREASSVTWGALASRPRRPVASSFEADVRRALRHSSGAFAAHPTYLATCFNLVTRMRVLNSVRYRSKTSSSMPTMGAMVAEMEELVRNGGRPSPGSDVNKIMKRIESVGKHVEGSPYHRKARRDQMYALDMHFGCGALFVTINLAPVHGEKSHPYQEFRTHGCGWSSCG